MRKPLMGGNRKMFKMAAETSAFLEKFGPLVERSTHCDIVICPTFTNLLVAVKAVEGNRIEIGSQDLFWAKEGAYPPRNFRLLPRQQRDLPFSAICV